MSATVSLLNGRQYALFIVSDSELQVTRDNTLLLVIASGIPCQLQNLRREVLKYRRKVN